MRTVLHELTHAMVFHPNLFEFYQDEKRNEIGENGELVRSTPLDESQLPPNTDYNGDSGSIYYLKNLPKTL